MSYEEDQHFLAIYQNQPNISPRFVLILAIYNVSIFIINATLKANNNNYQKWIWFQMIVYLQQHNT